MTTLPGDAAAILDEGPGAGPGLVPDAPATKAIQGRSPWQIGWTRLRRDKVAMVSGGFVLLVTVVAILAPYIAPHVGGGPSFQHDELIDPNLQIPYGSRGGMTAKHLLGVDPSGRDLLARILKGAWWSLLTAFCATALTVALGLVGGVVAGFFGGWVDSVINWLMAVFLAFPILLFGIALGTTISGVHFLGLADNNLHVAMMIFIIGFFGWAYFGRIIRGLVLSLREREFIDAARSLGASNRRILFRELVPNLLAPTLVFTSLAIPTNILAEAGFSFLGVGVQIPEPSWGGMLFDSLTYYQIDPAYLLVPGLAIFVTVLAFNLLGDGVRDAFDPKAGR
jgi:ABC-type dipeptide/oligopeptide/nickel transport system permease subunit